MITGAIFDIDGVILDSLGIWKELGTDFLANHNITTDPSICDILFSMSMVQGAEYLKENFLPDFTIEEILTELENIMRDFYLYEVKEKPGIENVLIELKKHNIPCIIATSNSRTLVTEALKRVKVLDYFQEIITTAEIHTNKHEPKVFYLAAEHIQSKETNTIVFEDSLYAIKTAKSAGFITIGIKDDLGEPDQQSLKLTSDYYLNNLDEFLTLDIL